MEASHSTSSKLSLPPFGLRATVHILTCRAYRTATDFGALASWQTAQTGLQSGARSCDEVGRTGCISRQSWALPQPPKSQCEPLRYKFCTEAQRIGCGPQADTLMPQISEAQAA